MSNERRTYNKERSKEVEQLDEYLLQEEIAYTLTRLDLAYLKYSTIFDKATIPVLTPTENITKIKNKNKGK